MLEIAEVQIIKVWQHRINGNVAIHLQRRQQHKRPDDAATAVLRTAERQVAKPVQDLHI